MARGFNVLVWVGGGEAEVNVGAEDLATGGRGVSDFLVGPIALALHGCEAVWWLSEGRLGLGGKGGEPHVERCTGDPCGEPVRQCQVGSCFAKQGGSGGARGRVGQGVDEAEC